MFNHQKGFTAVEAVVVVGVVALLSLAGWYVWSKNRGDGQPKPSNTTNQSVPPEQKKTTPSAGGFLTIAEWGVRFKTSTANADAYYLIKSELPGAAYLSVESLRGVDACGADSTTTGVYVRAKGTDIDERTGKTYAELYKNEPRIGDYYYTYEHPQAICSEDAATRTKAEAAMAAFSAGLDTVELVPVN